MRTQDVGSGVQSPYNILGNTSGTTIYGTAGTANSAVLSVQGIASGTNLPVSGASGAFASGSFASGSHASGSFASGAFASGSVASGALASGSIASGAMVDLGAIADAAATAGSTGTVNAKLRLMTTQLDTLNTNVSSAIPAGTNLIGQVRSVTGATGGGTLTSAIAPATPAGVNLKASAGTVFKVFATTIQSTPVYVKLYNASSAPTCGSGTPVARFMVPSAATAANGAGTNIDLGDIGAAFGTGIGYCVTGALADNDTTAITTANTLVNIVWN